MEIGISLGIQRGGGLSAIARAMATIDALSPTAWYHMRGSGVPTASGGFASMWPDMADADNGLVLPGVSGNYASTPDSVPLSITGSMDILVRMSASDWSPASMNTIVAKYGATGTISFVISVSTTNGRIRVITSADGTNNTIYAAFGTAPTVSDGGTIWLRVSLVPDNGSGSYVYSLYQATDASTEPSSWTKVGADLTGAATSIFDSTANLSIGAYGATGNTEPLNGTIKRVIIKNGIDGTTVFDADFSAQAKGTTSFTESSSNGATVTVNQSGALPAHIGNQKDLLQGTATNQPAYSAGVITFDGVDNYLKTNAFTLNQPETIYMVVKQVSWTSGDTLMDGYAGNSARIFQSSSTPTIFLYAGAAVCDNTGLTIGETKILCAVFSGAGSLTQVNAGTPSTGDAGASNAGGITLGDIGSTGSAANISVKEFVVFSAAHDAATRASVISALNTLNTVF